MAGVREADARTFIPFQRLTAITDLARPLQMYAYPYLERAPPMVKTYGVARAFNLGSDAVWDSVNRGVCPGPSNAGNSPERQWKDIKHKYLQSAEAEDDDDDE
ncbi:MAG: hypothetical protein Q9157_005595 [Trypethelium eluteriae]